MSARPSTIALLGANLIPVAGVAFLGWQVVDVLLLYWLENIAIGAINVLRMAVSRGKPGVGDSGIDRKIRAAIEAVPQTPAVRPNRIGATIKFVLIPFFIVHYGLFCWAHLSALTFLFDYKPGGAFGPKALGPSSYWVAAAALGFSHLFSFASNFIGNGEYRRTTPSQLMQRPYGRIVALHISIVAGGALVQILDQPVYMLIVLVAVKTVMDVRLHSRERNKFAAPADDRFAPP